MESTRYYPGYRQVVDVENEGYRTNWTEGAIRSCFRDSGTTLLDVGAGEQRFRRFVEGQGYRYFSHDFGEFVPSTEQPGLQDAAWDYPGQNFTCDILEIPLGKRFDVVLCTEVLEHVPDPVAALRKLYDLTKPGGKIIVTVPFLSLMHQAPFWFSSGLSPFWFRHWSAELGLAVDDLLVFGDFADLIAQENFRAFWPKYRKGPAKKLLSKVLRNRLSNAAHYRAGLPEKILTAGGFGTCFVGSKETPGSEASSGESAREPARRTS